MTQTASQASAANSSSPAALDQLVDALIVNLGLRSTVFHVGQYCGRWQASTAGHGRASYHLVLHGRCFVHIEGQAPFVLGPQDSVFFLRDVPHVLSSADALANAPRDVPLAAMQPLTCPPGGNVALACGFFHFDSALGESLLRGFPDYFVIRPGEAGLDAARLLFELILAESDRPTDAPSPLVARLVDSLLFYVMRHIGRSDAQAASLWRLAQWPKFAALLVAIMQEPANDWTVVNMARIAHMSRASFFKHFVEVSGGPPAQLVLLLRMRVASQLLRQGTAIAATAEHVGYQSISAFCRAFKRVHGSLPGEHRRGFKAANA